MKKILSDFLNLIFPKPEGETWKWVEIIMILGIPAIVAINVVKAS